MNFDEVTRIMVVGAGVMGHGIAQLFAQAGYEVRLVDINQNVLDRSVKLIRASLRTLVQQGMIMEDDAEAAMNRIRFETDLSNAVKDVDFLIEAVPEVSEIKKEIFLTLHRLCSPETIFATNTSGLDVFALAADTRPSHLVATHFFAPAQIIPLVEVCPGPETLPQVIDLTTRMLENVGKQPVVLKKFIPSFIVNRIQNYISMAVFEMLTNNWATPEEIDLAVKSSLGVRLPMVGVVQSLDFTGLDLVNDITKGAGIPVPLLKKKLKMAISAPRPPRDFMIMVIGPRKKY